MGPGDVSAGGAHGAPPIAQEKRCTCGQISRKLTNVARIIADQTAELARFVDQVNPDVPCGRSCRCWRRGLLRREQPPFLFGDAEIVRR